MRCAAQVDYFRRADVRKALHVSPLAFEWDVCSSHISYNYYAPTMAPLYQKVCRIYHITPYHIISYHIMPHTTCRVPHTYIPPYPLTNGD